MSTTTATLTAPIPELVDLTGRVAVVTGGAKGIGLGIAHRLHEAGASVVIADLDAQAAAGAADELRERRSDGVAITHTDVSDPQGAHDMIGKAVEQFGRLDILVNNAGIFPVRPLDDLALATFRRVIDVNLMGLFLCTQAAARVMVDQDEGGRIVNITSIDALHPSMPGLSHYDASKHGVWGFTQNVALELAPFGVWVNAVAPGGIRTPGVGDIDADTLAAFEAGIPMRRMGDPDEIGRAVLFLASDLASYITGTQLVVDGGRLLA